MGNQNVIFAGIINRSGEEIKACCSSGWIIRIIKPHDLGFSGYVLRNGIKVRQEVVPLQKGHKVILCSRQLSTCQVDRIIWIGQKYRVARVKQGMVQVKQAFL